MQSGLYADFTQQQFMATAKEVGEGYEQRNMPCAGAVTMYDFAVYGINAACMANKSSRVHVRGRDNNCRHRREVLVTTLNTPRLLSPPRMVPFCPDIKIGPRMGPFRSPPHT
jgi:hypothetical protein